MEMGFEEGWHNNTRKNMETRKGATNLKELEGRSEAKKKTRVDGLATAWRRDKYICRKKFMRKGLLWNE